MQMVPYHIATSLTPRVSFTGQEVTTLAGSGYWGVGSNDGTGTAAQFHSPQGVAYSPDGTKALVADPQNNKIREITVASGVVETLAGSGTPGSNDGTGTAAQFTGPTSVAYSPDGTKALVADKGNSKIREITVASGVVETLAGSGTRGSNDGTGTAAEFHSPQGVAYSPDGTKALVADTGNNKIREITVASGVVETLAGSGTSGSNDGTGTGAEFSYPEGVAYSPDGTKALVADTSNHKIREITVASGVVETLVGSGTSGSNDGTGTAAEFNLPYDVAYSPDGTKALVADTGNHNIRAIAPAPKCQDAAANNCDDNAACDDTIGGFTCTCNSGYEGTGDSCEIVCTRPSDTTGYDSIVETELSTATGFNVTAQCAANYQGTASVAACTVSSDYTLSGCSLIPDKTSDAPAVGACAAAIVMTVVAIAAAIVY
eukprot:COSAG02_NODE_9050_length_2349_cov_11.470667_1_plen_431_part_00